MPFDIVLTFEAQQDIRNLSSAIQQRILDKLEWIGQNANLLRHQALQGEEWPGCFKYRVGDYRIIYQIERSDRQLFVLKVGHRRDVYG